MMFIGIDTYPTVIRPFVYPLSGAMYSPECA
jgi:hypothetical protein